jgi:hypothetical protein
MGARLHAAPGIVVTPQKIESLVNELIEERISDRVEPLDTLS